MPCIYEQFYDIYLSFKRFIAWSLAIALTAANEIYSLWSSSDTTAVSGPVQALN